MSRMPGGDISNKVEKSFWEDDYLARIELPSRPDDSIPFERCLARGLAAHAPVAQGGTVLEIGCAPATWLVFYAERFGARVEGVEYSARGAELARRNLALAGVAGDIRHADFFELAPRPFDLVLSLGFIEHFDDLDRVLARHLEFVRPGGRLAIGVPNFRGVNRLLQAWADREHLRKHNLAAMKPSFYREAAARHGVELEHVGHLGGFDPIIIRLGGLGPRLATALEGRYRRLRVADRLNQRWLSSYLLAVMRR